MTSDAGGVDLLIGSHGTCADRECAAKSAMENGMLGEVSCTIALCVLFV